MGTCHSWQKKEEQMEELTAECLEQGVLGGVKRGREVQVEVN